VSGSGLARSGRGRRGGDRGDLPLNADINVTSLVDVAFTLLVIFIITAPVLQGGIEVSVPRAQVDPLTAQDDPFFVTVTRESRIYVEETPLSVADFRESFAQLASTGRFDRVYIRADSLAPYGPVLKVMSAVAQAGVDWSLVGEPYTPER
jgi:biopolymer transport protein ExbD